MHTHKTTEEMQLDIARQVRRSQRKLRKVKQWNVKTPSATTCFADWGKAKGFRDATGGEMFAK